MTIAIDPGHGLGNRAAGVFDPGAVKRVNGETFAEADIVLRYGHTLRSLLEAAAVEVFMTRTSSADPAALGGRARRAAAAGSTRYVSLHLNASTSSQANGIEVLFRDERKDRPLAEELQRRLVAITRLRDRGVKQRTDLAVLRFRPGPAVLIELGFLSNDGDRSFLIQGANRDAICGGISSVLTT